MSLHPVSLNVIRQAMNWSGFPQPIAIRKIDQKTQPTGAVWTAYRLEFRWSDLADIVEPRTASCVWPRYAALRERLERCFCDDVVVLGVSLDYRTKPVYATIITKCNPKGQD